MLGPEVVLSKFQRLRWQLKVVILNVLQVRDSFENPIYPLSQDSQPQHY